MDTFKTANILSILNTMVTVSIRDNWQATHSCTSPRASEKSLHGNSFPRMTIAGGENLFIPGTIIIEYVAANYEWPSVSHMKQSDVPCYSTWSMGPKSYKQKSKFWLMQSEPPMYLADKDMQEEHYELTRKGKHYFGQIYSFCPREEECFYLQTLQLHLSGAT